MKLRAGRRWLQAMLITCTMVSAQAKADLTIDISGGVVNQIPILIAPFDHENDQGQAVSPVVGADLQRTGLFRLVDANGVRLNDGSAVDFDALKPRGADVVLAGSVHTRPDGRYDVRFRLVDAVQQKDLLSFSFTAGAKEMRHYAHKVADQVYQKLTGDTGVFSTRIAFVSHAGKRYKLEVADYDGYDAQTLATSVEPIISPVWSPDGSRVAYVSFESRKPTVVVQSVATGSRRVIAAFKGNNSAPAWAPDGRRLAVVLTRDGHSQIYLINDDGSGLTRLSVSAGIDTEPSFAPDGKSILFTSDRGGSPQIYRMPLDGGPATRLTFDGSYNVSARFSPDGKSIVFIQRKDGAFRVASEDLGSGQVQVLSNSQFDESPSFAPNGKMVIYATEAGRRGLLTVASSDGRVRQSLTTPADDIRDPVWGPLLQN